jgi:hypothetical protein
MFSGEACSAAKDAISHRGTWANPEAVAKLGTMPDPALAKLLGITASAVFYKRKMMGIPPSRVSIET